MSTEMPVTVGHEEARMTGDHEQCQLAAFVARGIAATRPQIAKVDGKRVDRRRTVYRLVLSPEDLAGHDLRRLSDSLETPDPRNPPAGLWRPRLRGILVATVGPIDLHKSEVV
jgi:hypothetical protein